MIFFDRNRSWYLIIFLHKFSFRANCAPIIYRSFYFDFITNIENILILLCKILLFYAIRPYEIVTTLLTCWHGYGNALIGRSSARKSFQSSIFVPVNIAQWIAYFQYRLRKKLRLIEQLYAADLVASLHVYYTFTLSLIDAGQLYIPRFLFCAT